VAHDLLLNPDNQPWFSAVSLWEITTKSGLDRPDFRVDPNSGNSGTPTLLSSAELRGEAKAVLQPFAPLL